VLLVAMTGPVRSGVYAQAPAAVSAVPDLAGVWDGGGRARPVNSETVPWGKNNFPDLNERARAYQKVFDEAVAPKYDCQPATSPAIQYDPYMMDVVQWPDRVIFRARRRSDANGLAAQAPSDITRLQPGFLGRALREGWLLVETTQDSFDIVGFDDYNGIPSSTQKRVLERYTREGEKLRVTVTVGIRCS
jgi:hypothetical protein